MGVTDDREDPALRRKDPVTNLQEKYLVLSEAERVKGYVRPLRRAYRHVGPHGPRHPLRDLTDEERERYDEYVKFEEYPEDSSTLGRFWTQAQLDAKGCGTVTTMGFELAETYARDPQFYGGTYCAGCLNHFPVGPEGEFVWEDDQPPGQRVGT